MTDQSTEPARAVPAMAGTGESVGADAEPAPHPIARVVGSIDAGLAGASGGLLRLEDAALLGWMVVGVPIGRALGLVSGDPLSGGSAPVTGILLLTAVFLAISVVATRSPGDPVLGFDSISTPRSYAPMPFLLSLMMVSDMGLEALGLESGALIGVIFVVTMGSYVLYPHLPSLPRTLRRLMILPFIFVAGTVFSGIVGDLSALFDYRALLGDPNVTPSAFLGLFGFEVLLSGIFYLAFILAPRMVAEAEGTWRAWLVRYALWIAATIVSVTFLGAGG